MVQQQYDDEPVTLSYMAEVNQEIAAILPIFPLLLEGILGLTLSCYFRWYYSIGIEEYKWDEGLDKVIPTGEDNYLEEIDRHWIQHIEDYDTRNKHYKDNDHGGYAINVVLRPRLTDDGNESLIDDGDTDELYGL